MKRGRNLVQVVLEKELAIFPVTRTQLNSNLEFFQSDFCLTIFMMKVSVHSDYPRAVHNLELPSQSLERRAY